MSGLHADRERPPYEPEKRTPRREPDFASADSIRASGATSGPRTLGGDSPLMLFGIVVAVAAVFGVVAYAFI